MGVLPGAPADDRPPAKSPADAGVDAKALDELLEKTRAAKWDAVVLLVDGALVCEELFDRPPEPIELMSCTKSVVSLLVGILVDDGKIPSLETPVSKWFPEWRSGPKKGITGGHLLSHTSGLKCNPTTEEIQASRDFVKLALEAELVDPPGTRFFYNNKAVNLLAGVVEKASGRSETLTRCPACSSTRSTSGASGSSCCRAARPTSTGSTLK
jgi:CubicO group peptidase (beta-lactamase class C family)